jgi:hypothetical protein
MDFPGETYPGVITRNRKHTSPYPVTMSDGNYRTYFKDRDTLYMPLLNRLCLMSQNLEKISSKLNDWTDLGPASQALISFWTSTVKPVETGQDANSETISEQVKMGYMILRHVQTWTELREGTAAEEILAILQQLSMGGRWIQVKVLLQQAEKDWVELAKFPGVETSDGDDPIFSLRITHERMPVESEEARGIRFVADETLVNLHPGSMMPTGRSFIDCDTTRTVSATLNDGTTMTLANERDIIQEVWPPSMDGPFCLPSIAYC